ncbi:hypothetical protein J7U46_09645 [Pelomonas sp. V22]|uniref:hypothetical protein n=1 Tax=Pelomonas sp. V22 TaxID=2822139 RepID=UPI0024A9B89A|nr:hypothetical protein [Pelomonas sp. V22]MDI4633309.1 hypothetical protein [Pelomonas sp. V22]
MKLLFLPSESQRLLKNGRKQPHRLFTAGGEEIKGLVCIEVTPQYLEPVSLDMDGTVEYRRTRLADIRLSLMNVHVQRIDRRPQKKR